jgi:N-succinyldiaminopimelate aminotransferase
MNPGLEALQPYPFQRLGQLFKGISAANLPEIALTIGEPQHAPPSLVMEALTHALAGVSHYPSTSGSPALRASIAGWLERRFKLPQVDAVAQVLPVNGTREALFAIAQALVTPGAPGRVMSPNPFYQIYEGAALLAGTNPTFVPANSHSHFKPDFSQVTADDWRCLELLYICNPGNPSGAVMAETELQVLIALAQEHDFVIVSDECYSEIYPDENSPPAGLLAAAANMGLSDFTRCLCFHSLSKRSNLPGLRSGFVAGDADLIKKFTQYRTYHGCAMPPHHQLASTVAWGDETHVIANRAAYRAKFEAVVPILATQLNVATPDAGFYLWPETPVDDLEFACELLRRCNVAVLPGQFLGRSVKGENPGANRIRMALVADQATCVEAAQRMVRALEQGW